MTAHSLFDIRGKKALVTGGSIGIGRACATALAMGADVAIVDMESALGSFILLTLIITLCELRLLCCGAQGGGGAGHFTLPACTPC